MRNYFLILFLFSSLLIFSQEKLIKKRNVALEVIEIITNGLDDIVLENAINNELEVVLLDDNPNSHTISFEENIEALVIKFKLKFKPFNNGVYRKYITKRIKRASVVVKIPKGKKVIIYGETVGIESKNYKGDLSIFIDKGNVKLNTVQGNILVKLFLGNVYAQLNKNSSLEIETNKGEITLNKRKILNMYYEKKEISDFNFVVKSINANVILIKE